MHQYKLVSNQAELLNVAIPVMIKISDSVNDNSLIYTCSDKDLLLYKNCGIWGVNFNCKDKPFYIGPRVKYLPDMHDLVYGIDDVNFASVDASFDLSESEELSFIYQSEKVSKNYLTKIMDKGFYDYSEAIYGDGVQDCFLSGNKGGNWLIQHFGIRSGCTVDLHGIYEDVKNEKYITYIVIVPNDRVWDPCICKFFHSDKKEDLDNQIVEYLSSIHILDRQYNNFYLHEQHLSEPGVYMCGFLNMASVGVLYYTKTEVLLEKAGIPFEQVLKSE